MCASRRSRINLGPDLPFKVRAHTLANAAFNTAVSVGRAEYGQAHHSVGVKISYKSLWDNRVDSDTRGENRCSRESVAVSQQVPVLRVKVELLVIRDDHVTKGLTKLSFKDRNVSHIRDRIPQHKSARTMQTLGRSSWYQFTISWATHRCEAMEMLRERANLF